MRHRALVLIVDGRRHEPLLAGPGLQPVERGVDENAAEPHVERQFLPVLLDVQENLDEGVLHRFVRVRRVAQIVKRDP